MLKSVYSLIVFVFLGFLPKLLWSQSFEDKHLISKLPIFSHQYQYMDENYYRFVDTAFGNLNLYRKWNNSGKDLFEYSVLGSMGNALNSLTLDDDQTIWNYYDHRAFSPYFLNQDLIRFYSVKSALTEATYWQGYDIGQLFKIYHTQNINENLNYQLEYKRLNDVGFYEHNQVKQSSFNFSLNYESQNYKLKTYFLSEKLEIDENGGIEADSIFTENLETSRILLNVNLEGDYREKMNREFFLRQCLGMFTVEEIDSSTSKRRDFGSLGHDFKFSRRTDLYNGVGNTNFYSNYFNGTDTYVDSSYYYEYSNHIYWTNGYLPDRKLAITVGIKNLITEYLSENVYFTTNNLGFTGSLELNQAKFKIVSNIDYIFWGNLKSSINNSFSVKSQIDNSINWKVGYNFRSRLPDFYYWLNFSDNYVWQTDIERQTTSSIFMSIHNDNGSGVSGELYSIDNYLYLDDSSTPRQEGGLDYVRVQLDGNLSFWKNFMRFENRLLYQNVLSNQEILPLPQLVLRSSLYFNFSPWGYVPLSLGTEVKYFSRYKSRAYNPVLGLFTLEGAGYIGDYPLVDIVLSAKIKKATLFFKLEHANAGFMGYEYFAAPSYPFPDRIFRIGLSWRFFN